MGEVTCVLCGLRPAALGKGDHIPPICLYTVSERRAAKFSFHTVPACLPCNGGGSVDDEALKVLLSFESGEHRDAPSDVVDILARTVVNNRRFGNQIFNSAHRVSCVGVEGVATSKVSVLLDAASYRRAISRIARAMYWTITGSILGGGVRLEALALREFSPKFIDELQDCVGAFPLTEVNGGSLKAKLIDTEKGEMLLLQFFGKHTSVAVIYRGET